MASDSLPPEIELNRMRGDHKKMLNKLYDVSVQSSEYSIAYNALEALPKDRRCFRMVGLALVEHTVGEVVPLIKERSEQFEKLQEGLQKNVVEIEEKMNKYATEHNLLSKNDNVNDSRKATAPESKNKPGLLL